MFKRVLMAVAVAAAVSAPAFAEVTISGVAAVEFTADTSGSANGDGNGMDFNMETPVKISFDGSDKLDSGSTFFWRVSQKPVGGDETYMTASYSPKSSWGARELFVGFKGDWGTFKVGRMFSDMYLAQDWPFAFGGVGVGTVWDEMGTDIYLNQAISYASPSFGGFSFTAQASSGNGVNEFPGDNDTTKGSSGVYGVGLSYWGPFAAFLNYEVKDSTSGFPVGSVNGYENIHGGVRATFGDFGVKAAAKHVQFNDKTDVFGYLVGGWYSMGKLTVGAAYQAYLDSDTNGVDANDGMQQVVVEANYGLSKNTSVTARVSHFMLDSAASYGWGNGVGGYMVGGPGANTNGVTGKDSGSNTRFLLAVESGF